MKRFFNLLRSSDNKRIAENFFSLSILNVINYVFPLVLIPYLTRVLGVEKYGIYVFAFALLNYISLLIKYGFELSATKQVAIVRNNKEELSKLFFSVLSVRLMLFIISLLILVVLVYLSPVFYENKELLFNGIGILFGIAITPIWFFQGMEKMKFLTIINFLSKLSSTILIFVFITKMEHYADIMLYQSIGFMIAGILSLYIAVKSFNLKLVLPNTNEIYLQFKDGWQLFLSTIGMNFYRESNIIILGLLTDFTITGYYAAAEKIIKAIQSILSPFVNALFPFFARKLNSGNQDKSRKSLIKVGKIYILGLSIITLLVLSLSPIIINSYLGEGYVNSIIDIRIMSLVIVIGGINYYFGIIGLVNLGKDGLFTRSVWISGILSIIICFILVPSLSDIGASIALVSAEVILATQVIYYFRKNKLGVSEKSKTIC